MTRKADHVALVFKQICSETFLFEQSLKCFGVKTFVFVRNLLKQECQLDLLIRVNTFDNFQSFTHCQELLSGL